MPVNYNKLDRKVANDVVKWYFDHYDADKTASSGLKHSEDKWAELLISAISSFNKGLEDTHFDRQASVDDVVDMVGSNAFNMIAMLVVAQHTHRLINQAVK